MKVRELLAKTHLAKGQIATVVDADNGFRMYKTTDEARYHFDLDADEMEHLGSLNVSTFNFNGDGICIWAAEGFGRIDAEEGREA